MRLTQTSHWATTTAFGCTLSAKVQDSQAWPHSPSLPVKTIETMRSTSCSRSQFSLPLPLPRFIPVQCFLSDLSFFLLSVLWRTTATTCEQPPTLIRINALSTSEWDDASMPEHLRPSLRWLTNTWGAGLHRCSL